MCSRGPDARSEQYIAPSSFRPCVQAEAIPKALEKAGLSKDDVEVFEVGSSTSSSFSFLKMRHSSDKRGCPRTAWRCSRWAPSLLVYLLPCQCVCTCCTAEKLRLGAQQGVCLTQTRLLPDLHLNLVLFNPSSPSLPLCRSTRRLPASLPTACRRWASTPRRSTPTEVGRGRQTRGFACNAP